MDINEQLQPIVASIIQNLQVSLESEVRSKITAEVVKKISNLELEGIVHNLIKTVIGDRIALMDFESASREQIDIIVAQTVQQINQRLADAANAQLTAELKQKLQEINVHSIVNAIIRSELQSLVDTVQFPINSIPHSSINFQNFTVSGDIVKGGIIEDFGSTGIEDKSSFVQLTLMDHACVFEGPVYTPELHVKGTLEVEGDLIVKGDIPTDSSMFINLVNRSAIAVKNSMNDEFFESYANVLHKTISENGLDLNRITQNGKDVISNNQIGYHITDSNLQRLGIVNDLQTSGENLLSETLYVTNRRVGVNTMDPSSAFVVWDEECEVIVGKKKQDTPYIGTIRNQSIIIGSNNKENIRITQDGKVYVEQLSVGKTLMSSIQGVPNFEGSLGDILWNEKPNTGDHIGWVCLGGARWAKFGKIE